MQRLIAHRYEHTLVLDGTDRVLFGITLPSDSRLNNIRATVQVTHGSISADVDHVGMYEIAGYILPLPDVDASPQFDVLWDTLVPKQQDDDLIEMDSGAAVADPAFEPGEESLEELYNVGFQPEEIYKRRVMVGVGHPASSFFFSTTPQFRFNEQFKLNVSKNYHVQQPSVVLFGISAPSLVLVANKATTPRTALTGIQIAELKYMTGVLERAFYDLIGRTEGGAESPWEEATSLLKLHLEPNVVTDGSDESKWTNFDYDVHVVAMIDHSVTGKFGLSTISAGQ